MKNINNIDDAVKFLRTKSAYEELVTYSYLDENVLVAAERFYQSSEFVEVVNLLKCKIDGGTILDLGAGNGIASYAFSKYGANKVYALEPCLSENVGANAIRKLIENRNIELLNVYGESIPLESNSIDLIYCRQVLHHVKNIKIVLAECARVLKNGGVFFACREHVVCNNEELAIFLQNHVLHQLIGNENAYKVGVYVKAIKSSGLKLVSVLRPFDSIINAYPTARNNNELEMLFTNILTAKLGKLGKWVYNVPILRAIFKYWLNRKTEPGRLYSFMAVKI